jgi:hypothetical protein
VATAPYSASLSGQLNCTYTQSSVISGGYKNCINGSGSVHGVIGGGIGNSISNYSDASIIGGGRTNQINCSPCSTISGGYSNSIQSNSNFSSIGGGYTNSIARGYNVRIGGGNNNCSDRSNNAFIGGGENNKIDFTRTAIIVGGTQNYSCFNRNSVIGGGIANYIIGCNGYDSKIRGNGIFSGNLNLIANPNTSGCYNNYNVIGGGQYNCIVSTYFSTNFNFIGSGKGNTICANSSGDANYNTIIGGCSNTIAKGSHVHVIGYGITTGGGSNCVYMNNLRVFGNVSKGSGSFTISHPNPEKTQTHKLIHSFVESPTAGDNIYRYEVEVIDGVATIELPDYYEFLNENTQVWVTAKNGFGMGYGVVSEDLKSVTIFANTDLIYNILIIGTRKDRVAKKYWQGVEVKKTDLEQLQREQ